MSEREDARRLVTTRWIWGENPKETEAEARQFARSLDNSPMRYSLDIADDEQIFTEVGEFRFIHGYTGGVAVLIFAAPAGLAAATEGSAELDREVLLACGWRPENAHEVDWFDPKRPDRWILRSDLPRPTRSLDDITRMIEAEGMRWEARMIATDQYDAWVGSVLAEKAQTAPLGLVRAFLRAREAGR